MLLKYCACLCGHLSTSPSRYCWSLGSLFDSLTDAVTNAARKADDLSSFLDARLQSAENPVQKALTANLLHSSQLAARAANGLSAEVFSLVKVAGMAAELYEVNFCFLRHPL